VVEEKDRGHKGSLARPDISKRDARTALYERTMPIGYLVTTAIASICTFLALAAPRPRRSSPSNAGYWLAILVNELPFALFYWLLASTLLAVAQDDVATPLGWVALGLAAATTLALGVIVWRGLLARGAVERAVRDGLGDAWRAELDPALAAGLRRRIPLGRVLLAPLRSRPRSVERIANVAYGDEGRMNLLDVYRHRSRPSRCPTLVHLHGGAFRSGRKSREALPLLYRLASEGWVCVSANYRLSPGATFPDHLVDVKRAIAWLRAHADEYGIDLETIVGAGSSAGGHLAVMAALTPNDPAYQPGFEEADTSVSAAVSLYGFYGSPTTFDGRPSTPLAYVRADAPPVFVAHGDRDTLVLVEDARHFVDVLRKTSRQPVVYAELPGAHHTFDLVHSIRFEAVVDGIEGFLAWLRSTSASASRTRGHG
jgi:acetyl esterase/lipase